MRKVLKVLIYLGAVVLGLSLIYILVVMNNKIELKPDPRYSSIGLEIDASPISKKLDEVVKQKSRPVKGEDRIQEIYGRVESERDEQNGDLRDWKSSSRAVSGYYCSK